MPRAKKAIPSLRHSEALVKATGYKVQLEIRGSFVDVFHDHSEEIMLSACAGTGKSRIVLEKIHLMLSKYKGARAFMARKTRNSMTNSVMKTFEHQVLKPMDKVHLHKNEQVYNYPNGSEFAVCGLDNPEKIKSTEWDVGYIQEATECTLHDWEMCTSRLRSGTIPYQQLIGDCNPDKPTHWIKLREAKSLLKMFHSTLKDNPRWWNGWEGKTFYPEWTPAGAAYDGKLSRLTGVRRSRLYLGLWVAAEGVVYDKWDAHVNMISRSELPDGWEEWPHYWAIDWGYIHPFAWGDFIQSPDTGAIYLLHQIYKTKTLIEDHCKMIAKAVEGRLPRAIITDHDAGDRAEFEKHMSAQMNQQMLTLPAFKPIGIGIQNLQARVSCDPKWGGGPGFFVVRDSLVHNEDQELVENGSPVKMEDEMDGYVWDVKHNEDVNSKKDEIPIDKDNHGVDYVRYMAAFMDDLAIDPQNIEETFDLNEEFEEQISKY